jgi:hypothetical protein
VSLFIGATLALVVGLLARLSSFDRDRAFYPTVLLIVAHYYLLFGIVSGSHDSLLGEFMVFVPFLVASFAGFKWTPWFVVVGLGGHGVLDLFHSHVVTNPGVPVWWPDFCLAYDVVAAGLLATLLRGAAARGSPQTRFAR